MQTEVLQPKGMTQMEVKTKREKIPEESVFTAWRSVKSNAGAAGVDNQTIEEFGADLNKNLYKIWNRMTSDSYFPPAVKGVEIPKRAGGVRLLGIPTVGDRVAQTIIAQIIEPRLERIFHEDSYGYRPEKSAHQAIEVTRRRCWKCGYVLEYDIKGLFDNLSHELLMRAVKHHIEEKWIQRYIERWLKAPLVLANGTVIERTSGTPQGGVISPLLANLFLHYAIDAWMSMEFPKISFARYADDGLIHCTSRKQAKYILERLTRRLQEVGLEIHPDKTKIVNCSPRSEDVGKFTFLGYEFRKRSAKNTQTGEIFQGFLPAIGRERLTELRQKVRTEFKTLKQYQVSLNDIAKEINAVVRGWINYYGKFHGSAMTPIREYLNQKLIRWCQRKYTKMKSITKASRFLKRIHKRDSNLFAHWKDSSFVF